MQKVKWGDLPLGAIVFVNGHPHHIVDISKRGVCVLDLYHNRLTRRRASTQANVVLKQASV